MFENLCFCTTTKRLPELPFVIAIVTYVVYCSYHCIVSEYQMQGSASVSSL